MERFVEKRKHVRLPKELYVISRVFLTTEETREKLLLTQDISGGGMGFRSKEKIEPGATMHVKIHLPTLERPIDAAACVVRVDALEPRRGYSIGLEFTEIGAQDKKEVIKFLTSCLMTKPDIDTLFG